MSEANVKAEAILIVIKKIVKWICLSIVGIGIIIFGGLQYEEYEVNKRRAIEDKVLIQAFHPKDQPCSKDFPYQYTIVNNSGKTINKVSFEVEIKRLGFSSDINRYLSLFEDKIISHNESYGRCFRAEDIINYGKDLTEKNVIIEIKNKSIIFQE